MLEEGIEKKAKGISKAAFVLTVIVLFIVFFAALVGYKSESEAQLEAAKERYSIEARVLLSQLMETEEFRSKENWDLNEWLPVKNKYIERRYNLLLGYNDSELGSLLRQQEDCLASLYYFYQKGDTNSQYLQADECNRLGESIDERVMELLIERLGGETQ